MSVDSIFSGLKVIDLSSFIAAPGACTLLSDFGAEVIKVEAPGSGDPHRNTYKTAVGLYSAIVTALYRRERTGKGAYVTTSLLAEGAWAGALQIQAALCGAKFGPLHDRKAPANPLFNPYQTSDGGWLMLILPAYDWPKFAIAIGRPEVLIDARFTDEAKRAANSAKLTEIIDETFTGQPLKYWRERLDQDRLTYGVLQTPFELVDDPQARANDIIVPLEGAGEHLKFTVSSPLKIHGVDKVSATAAPEIGEHNQEVLEQLGFDADEIDDLRASGAIPHVWHFNKAAAAGGVR